jgi:hypothetical protein
MLSVHAKAAPLALLKEAVDEDRIMYSVLLRSSIATRRDHCEGASIMG